MKTSESKRKYSTNLITAILVLIMIAGQACSQKSTEAPTASTPVSSNAAPQVETLADNLNHPWGMAFLPDGRLLVTERAGTLRILDKNNKLSEPLQEIGRAHV